MLCRPKIISETLQKTGAIQPFAQVSGFISVRTAAVLHSAMRWIFVFDSFLRMKYQVSRIFSLLRFEPL